MKISERELEDFIFENLQKNRKEYLSKLGLCFLPSRKDDFDYTRQMSLGYYGRCDIIGLEVVKNNDANLNYHVNYKIIELKEGEITKDIIFQCMRYKNAVDDEISHSENYNHGEIIIIGSSISKETFDLIKTVIGRFTSVYLYTTCLYKGLTFEYISDSYFYNHKCCSDPSDPENNCDGNCHISLKNGNSLYKKINEQKVLNRITPVDNSIFSFLRNNK